MAVKEMGLTPMSPVMFEAVVEMPLMVRMAKLPAVPRGTGAAGGGGDAGGTGAAGGADGGAVGGADGGAAGGADGGGADGEGEGGGDGESDGGGGEGGGGCGKGTTVTSNVGVVTARTATPNSAESAAAVVLESVLTAAAADEAVENDTSTVTITLPVDTVSEMADSSTLSIAAKPEAYDAPSNVSTVPSTVVLKLTTY